MILAFWPNVDPGAFRDASKRLLPMLLLAIFVGGCETGPQLRSVVLETYVIEAVGGTQKQTRENITVEDLGEAQKAAQPVEVQACDGPHLLFQRIKRINSEGQEYTRTVPAYEIVDPLFGIYVRRLKITNGTEHTLRLNRVDAVLVDGAGNDREGMDKEMLAQAIRVGRPCSSTHALIETMKGLKLLGADIRIRPGRETTLLVAFSGVDKSIIGGWTLELHDFLVPTNEAEVTRVTSFEFPLEAKGYRTTIRQRKEGTFAPWKEIGRSTEEMAP